MNRKTITAIVVKNTTKKSHFNAIIGEKITPGVIFKHFDGELSVKEIKKRGGDVEQSFYADIDTHAPSKGFFNRRKVA